MQSENNLESKIIEWSKKYEIPEEKLTVLLREVSEYNRIEKELKESEKKYRTLVEISSDAIAIHRNNRWLYVNRKALELFGYDSFEEIKKMPALGVIHPDDREKIAERINSLVQKEIPLSPTLEERLIRKDGSTINAEVSASLINYEGKEAVLVLAKDITSMKKTQQKLADNEEKYRDLFEKNVAGIYLSTLEGKILECNQALTEMFGYSSTAEIKKVNSNELYFHDETLSRKKFLNDLKHHKVIKNREYKLRKKDGSPIIVLENSFKQNNLLFGAMIDITPQKQAEQKLKKTYEELESSNSLKSLLLDVITHDLKSPVWVIQGFAEVLVNERNTETLYEMAGYIKQSSEQVLDILKNITSLAKIESGDSIQKEELDLTEIIKVCVNNYDKVLQQNKMYIENLITMSLPVKANRIISEVFDNYISNAIKYAKDGQRIVIESGQKNKQVTVYVKDFGTATIHESMQRKIFERATQIEKGRGSGLGLSIVKKIAESHDAEVGVIPNEPQGNIFYLRIKHAYS